MRRTNRNGEERISRPESRQVVEIPWGLSPGYTAAELTTAQGCGA